MSSEISKIFQAFETLRKITGRNNIFNNLSPINFPLLNNPPHTLEYIFQNFK